MTGIRRSGKGWQMETVLVLRRNMVKTTPYPNGILTLRLHSIAELRGPALRQRYNRQDLGESSPSERPGNIILLGDGRHILTDGDDTHMFDYGDEDRDLESQASKDWEEIKNGDVEAGQSKVAHEAAPLKREKSQTPEPSEEGNPFDTPSSTTSEKSEDNSTATPNAKVIPETALPTKFFSPGKENKDSQPPDSA